MKSKLSKKRKKQQHKRTSRQAEFMGTVPRSHRPPPGFHNPEEPGVKVVKEKFIRDWLFRGWTLTTNQAWGKFGHTRLADVIYRMRNKGVTILTNMTTGLDRHGNKTRYAKYKYVRGKMLLRKKKKP